MLSLASERRRDTSATRGHSYATEGHTGYIQCSFYTFCFSGLLAASGASNVHVLLTMHIYNTIIYMYM